MKQRDFGKYMKCIMHNMMRNIDNKVASEGVTAAQGKLIGFLARKECAGVEVFQKDVEEEFNIRRSSVTSVLQSLEKNGCITRESVKRDARLKKIVLTDKGREMQNKVYQTILREEEKVLQVLTKEEKEQLFVILEKLEGASNELSKGGK